MKSKINLFLDPITTPVGKRLLLKGRTFEVVEEVGCNGCYFFRPFGGRFCTRNPFYKDNDRGDMTFNEAHSLGRCCKDLRTDKIGIIFKEIKQPENDEQEISTLQGG